MKKSKLLATVLLCTLVYTPSIAMDSYDNPSGKNYTTKEDITTVINNGDFRNQHTITTVNTTGIFTNAGGGSISTATNAGSFNNYGQVTNQITNYRFLNNFAGKIKKIINATGATAENYKEVTEVVNNGTFENKGGATVETAVNDGTFSNHGNITNKIENYGSLTNYNGTIAKVINGGSGNVDNYSTVTEVINAGTYNNTGDGIVGTVTNTGRFANHGKITDKITNYGNLMNYNGTIAKVINAEGATTENYKNVTEVVNNGIFENKGGATVETAVNSGTFSNHGKITNQIENYGSLTNYNGTIAKVINAENGNVDNYSTVTEVINTGSYNNTGDGIVSNAINSGTFSNHGKITNKIENYGSLSNYDGTIAKVVNGDSGTTNNYSKVNNVLNTGTFNNKANGSVETLVNGGNFSNETNAKVTGLVTNAGTFNNDGIVSGHIDNIVETSVLNSNANNIKNTVSNSGTYNISGGTISYAIDEYLEAGTLNIGNGIEDILVTNINGNTIIQTNVNVNSGAVFDNAGTVTAGILGNRGSIADSNNSGTLNISGGSNISEITQNTINITQNSSFDNTGTITAGTLNNNGNITDSSNSGSLIVSDGQNNANCTITQKSFKITDGGQFITEGEMNLNTLTNNGNLIIKNGGNVNVPTGLISSALSTITVDNALFELQDGTADLGTYVSTGQDETKRGNINLKNSTIAESANIRINEYGNLKLENSSTVNFNDSEKDKWAGRIYNTDSVINASNFKNDKTAGLIQDSGTVNIDNSDIYIGDEQSSVTGGDLNVINKSKLTFKNSNKIAAGNLNIDSNSVYHSGSNGFTVNTLNSNGLVNGINNSIESYNIGTLTTSSIVGSTADASSTSNFAIDLKTRTNYNNAYSYDMFNNISDITNLEKVNISDIKLNGDIYGWDAPIDRQYKMIIFNDVNGNPFEGNVEFTSTANDVFTPIGWYRLNNLYGKSGQYTFDLMKYNPQVFRGQVTTLAQYQNQLGINDMLFTHSMLLPSFKEEYGGVNSSIMANRYAATSPVFAPYQYSRKDGGLWYKMYGQFETLQMDQQLSHVTNNSYGALIGADFGLKELRNNWKFMPTAYIGYNGAHQAFHNVSAYQNGGQLGFLGTFYKENFILGTLLFGGIYDNSMDIGATNGARYSANDETFNYFGGIAIKPAYNIRLHRDWVLQPNLYAGYTYFGQQNWHSTFGQMGMMSGMLNGVNIAPGMNLIWERETFSMYLTLQYMYNVAQYVSGRAGNVSLPNINMERGYIQYGIGFTKKFSDRLSGYFQAVLRNVGRTGCGFQLGLNYKIGK